LEKSTHAHKVFKVQKREVAEKDSKTSYKDTSLFITFIQLLNFYNAR
jgi:uncharacterized membrane protein